MKVTDFTRRTLAQRRTAREMRKHVTLADLMDRLDILRSEVMALGRTIENERRMKIETALAKHYGCQ